MVYKNGIKEYTPLFLIFGALFGLIFGLYRASIVMGIITSVVCGLVFVLLMLLFVKHIEKTFDKKRKEIARERKIICDGGVTVGSIGGWMFLTEQGLEFYPHKFNHAGTKRTIPTELIIPMDQVASLETVKNRIQIHTTEEQTYVIIVSHQKEWKKQIEDRIRIKE